MRLGFRNSVVKVVVPSFFVLGQVTLAWADAPLAPTPGGAAPGSAPAEAPSPMMNLLPFVAMFAILYFLMIRPQQKKMKEQQAMIAAIKDGDEVITNSGIIGKVTGITEKVVTLEVDKNVRIKLLKSQISQVVKGPIADNV